MALSVGTLVSKCQLTNSFVFKRLRKCCSGLRNVTLVSQVHVTLVYSHKFVLLSRNLQVSSAVMINWIPHPVVCFQTGVQARACTPTGSLHMTCAGARGGSGAQAYGK